MGVIKTIKMEKLTVVKHWKKKKTKDYIIWEKEGNKIYLHYDIGQMFRLFPPPLRFSREDSWILYIEKEKKERNFKTKSQALAHATKYMGKH